MYHSAFNKKWFAKHQKLILKALNTPVIKRLFRFIWKIETKGEVTYLDTNSVWYIEDGKHKTEFRTHNKYAKRLYFSLKPIWWLLHTWDLFADNYAPQLSFGFDTLTAYPDADPGSTSCDGYSYHYDGSGLAWSAMVAAAGNGSQNSSTTLYLTRIRTAGDSGLWIQMNRGFALFDTSGIDTGKIISGAVLSFYGTSKADPQPYGLDLNIYSATPDADTGLVDTDFAEVGSTAFSDTLDYADYAIGSYNDFTLNEDGITAIAVEGITKFSIRDASHDAANSAPSWQSNKDATILCSSADATGTSQDPKLVVTYTDALFAPFPSHFLP